MKFGQEFQKALESEEFPAAWRDSAIEYKHLKKCIKKIHRELEEIGLSPDTVNSLNELIETPAEAPNGTSAEGDAPRPDGYYSAATPVLPTVPEEFSPQLRVLVDSETGTPLDATLAPDTRASLQKLARHELVTAGRRSHIGAPAHGQRRGSARSDVVDGTDSEGPSAVTTPPQHRESRWIQIPLASAKDFFDLLTPKLEELEHLREAETQKLEAEIMDLGDMVEDVVEPVREGYEATRSVSYRDLYFWREMFRLYTEQPIFYEPTASEQQHQPQRGNEVAVAGVGALTFAEAKRRLERYDAKLRETGLLRKLKTPLAQRTAQQFLDLNVEILKIMHFQEMNARAMTKILKKFDKQTHLDGEGALFLQSVRRRYPALMQTASPTGGQGQQLARTGGFASSIARDLNAEMATKVLAIVPQLDDWNCPVCYGMAWRPVSLGCCRSRFCIRCIVRLQQEGVRRCPVCDGETVLTADGRNIDFDAMDFLEKFFPIEVRRRQKENERGELKETVNGDSRDKPGCAVM